MFTFIIKNGKYTLCALLLAFVGFFPVIHIEAASALTLQTVIGEVVSKTGKVTATQPEGETRELELTSPVFLHDTLWTDKLSTLEVRFTDETMLAQGPDSTLSLDDFIYSSDPSLSNLLFQMGEGTFRYISGEIVKQNPDAFVLKTPLSTIGIRGTEPFAIVEGEEEKIGVISIEPGHVVNITTAKRTVTIDRPGLSTNVKGDGSISSPGRTPKELHDRVVRDAPMTSRGERGPYGEMKDRKQKVEAFKQHMSWEKSKLGPKGGKPEYGRLHTISLQKSGKMNAENERDGKSHGSSSQLGGRNSNGGFNSRGWSNSGSGGAGNGGNGNSGGDGGSCD